MRRVFYGGRQSLKTLIQELRRVSLAPINEESLADDRFSESEHQMVRVVVSDSHFKGSDRVVRLLNPTQYEPGHIVVNVATVGVSLVTNESLHP